MQTLWNISMSLLSGQTNRQSSRPPFLGGLGALLLFLVLATPCAAIVYVDKDRPGGNGTSWAQAYKTLDAAISNTYAPAEFWIAEGTYTPSAPLVLGLNQNHSFYGGFAGTETARSQRNITKYPTIVDGQGVLKHVFNVTSWVTSVRFDGLTIKRGAATAASGADASGGGIVVNKGTVVIASCTFSDNKATHIGGAVNLVNNPSITVTGSTFKNNKSLSGSGGGAGLAMIWDQTGAQPAATVEKCIFQGNTGGAVGGGLYSIYFPVTVRESTFIANSSANGGAIMLDYKLPAADRIERCLFSGNTATERGGAICSFARSMVIENSVFAYNTTTLSGGGVGLHSGLGDAANYNANYSGTFRNCTFYGNNADTYGGGIENIGGRPMYIYNSIFWDNTAQAYFMDGATRPTNDIANYETPATVHYTDMETLGWANPPAFVDQVGSFSDDPLCSDPDGTDDIPGSADDNLSIQDLSPCTDRADGNYAPATDIVLRSRVDNPAVPNLGAGTPNYADIGAYEGPYTPPVVIPPPVVPDGVNMAPVLHLLLSKTIFEEDFEGAWPPQGWTIEDWAGNGLNWVRSDMAGTSNRCLYGSGYSAAADSDMLDGSGVGMFTVLNSPPINLFAPQAYLGYASNFQVMVSSGIIWLQISTNNGSSWTTLRYQTVDDPAGGTWEVEDLTAYVGKTILLRWIYWDENDWAWWWHIDNIVIKKEIPLPPT
jgi:hypothetical protein